MATAQGADALIVGAGLGGSFLALLLGRAGLRVVVIDAAAAPPAKGAEILKPRGVRLLDEHRVLTGPAQVQGDRRHIIGYHHDGALFDVYDYREHTPLGYFLVAPYEHIADAVAARARSLSNVEFRFSTGISEVHRDHDQITSVTLTDGGRLSSAAIIDSGGEAPHLRAHLNTSVAARRFPSMWAAVVPGAPPAAFPNRLYFSSTGRFAYLYQLGEDLRIFIGAQDDDLATGPAGSPGSNGSTGSDLAGRLRPFVVESKEVLDRVAGARYFPVKVSSRLSRRYHRGNVALLGSSAFACHPMTGQGMSYTLEDAAALADVIERSGGDSRKLDALLSDSYEPRRRSHERLIRYGDGLADSYQDLDRYRAAFDSAFHGGDSVPA